MNMKEKVSKIKLALHVFVSPPLVRGFKGKTETLESLESLVSLESWNSSTLDGIIPWWFLGLPFLN